MGVIAATSLHAATIFQVLLMWTEKNHPKPNKDQQSYIFKMWFLILS